MNDYTDILLNTQTLIRFPSITPNDHGLHAWMANALSGFGYQCHSIEHADVTNLLALPKHGLNAETLLFVGHSDVVPVAGQAWSCDPFAAVIDQAHLIGRGAVDMKSSLAAMMTAIATLHQQKKYPNIALLITSNEEGDNNFGIEYVLKHHGKALDAIQYVLIGEPTSVNQIGDTIKVGRRGSLNLTLKLNGSSEHVAYSQPTNNVVHIMNRLLHTITQTTWGESHQHFQDTQMTLVGMQANSEVFNVTSTTCHANINWRYNPSLTSEKIMEQINTIIDATPLGQCTIETHWYATADPFSSQKLDFAHHIAQCIFSQTQNLPEFTTSGGTSDARFFNPDKHQVVEFGPRHAYAHQANESIHVDELQQLADIYLSIANAFSHEVDGESLDHLVK
jgi:succinyl-diaminopimelate desuccinylase